jgi:hypothetical protein
LLGLGQQHIAQHFSGHDDDLGVAVVRGVAGEQTDAAFTKEGAQFVELLVGECL